jgi:hypothetical protein
MYIGTIYVVYNSSWGIYTKNYYIPDELGYLNSYLSLL